MTERVLTTRERNRALLARQHLLSPSKASLPRTVERIGGLQTQYAPSAYIGLWSRSDGFRREHLTRALERRTVIQGTLMRSTIHIVSRADYWLFASGTRAARREWWTRIANGRRLGELDHEAMAAHLHNVLASGPVHRKELISSLEDGAYPREAWEGVGAWIDMVRVPPSGTWERRRADLYADASAWVGPEIATERDGLEHLLIRYLGAFGPATTADAANWAGVPVTPIRVTAERLTLRRFRAEDDAELVDVPRRPLPDADTPAPVRFLPTWDATLLAHARASGILPDDYRPLVFHTRNPHSVTTFLVDGSVAGTWREEGGRVIIEPYHPIPRRVGRDLEEEADRLAVFLTRGRSA